MTGAGAVGALTKLTLTVKLTASPCVTSFDGGEAVMPKGSRLTMMSVCAHARSVRAEKKSKDVDNKNSRNSERNCLFWSIFAQ